MMVVEVVVDHHASWAIFVRQRTGGREVKIVMRMLAFQIESMDARGAPEVLVNVQMASKQQNTRGLTVHARDGLVRVQGLRGIRR